MIADMDYVVPDPLAETDPFNNLIVGANVSTLRVACQPNPGEWIVVQDYRSQSVLNGLSEVGGLGAFASALFVVWFGTTLLRITNRTFPLSPLCQSASDPLQVPNHWGPSVSCTISKNSKGF